MMTSLYNQTAAVRQIQRDRERLFHGTLPHVNLIESGTRCFASCGSGTVCGHWAHYVGPAQSVDTGHIMLIFNIRIKNPRTF